MFYKIMKLYHGSPKLLESLEPQLATGRNEYQNQKAIFLTTEFLRAALYAIGKTLKGTTAFAVTRQKLIILGDKDPGDGYVYEFQISEDKLVKGDNTDEYSTTERVIPIKVHIVHSADYASHTVHVHAKTKEEFFGIIDNKSY